jgi:hypothetical protein
LSVKNHTLEKKGNRIIFVFACQHDASPPSSA